MGRARTRSTGAVAVCAAVARVVAVAGPRVWLVGVVERGVVGPGTWGGGGRARRRGGDRGLAGEVADEADGVAWVGPVAPVGAAAGSAAVHAAASSATTSPTTSPTDQPGDRPGDRDGPPGSGARRRVLTGPGYVPGARVWDPRRIRGQPLCADLARAVPWPV